MSCTNNTMFDFHCLKWCCQSVACVNVYVSELFSLVFRLNITKGLASQSIFLSCCITSNQTFRSYPFLYLRLWKSFHFIVAFSHFSFYRFNETCTLCTQCAEQWRKTISKWHTIKWKSLNGFAKSRIERKKKSRKRTNEWKCNMRPARWKDEEKPLKHIANTYTHALTLIAHSHKRL